MPDLIHFSFFIRISQPILFFFILCLICVLCIAADTTPSNGDMELICPLVIINILTRTGTRPEHFKILEDSIKSQTCKNIRHIVSCDNPNCKTYLNSKDDLDVIQV